MIKRLLASVRRWREKNRQYAIERALYKAGGGADPRDAQPGSPPQGESPVNLGSG